MAKRKRYRPKTSFYLLVLSILMIVLGIAMMHLLDSFSDNPDVDTSFEETVDPISFDFNEELSCVQIHRYTGMYMEDGSNEMVTNVMAMVIENRSEQDLQYAEFTLTYDSESYEFSVTDLPASQSCVLLELNRKTYVDRAPDSVEAHSVTYFHEPMDTLEHQLQIHGQSGTLNVKNISGVDIHSDVYVYYKYAMDDKYFGGITFRVKINGGIAANETIQVSARHFDPKQCVVTQVVIYE